MDLTLSIVTDTELEPILEKKKGLRTSGRVLTHMS